MRYLALLTMLILPQLSQAECAYEYIVKGEDIHRFVEANKSKFNIYIEDRNHRFIPHTYVRNFSQQGKYHLQVTRRYAQDGFRDYNRKYLPYYRYKRVQDYLKLISYDLKDLGYRTIVVGKSLEGRNLYAVYPNKIDPTKKTVVMFGRHHGDEGTANWIIEGFVNELLNNNKDWFQKHQLVLYPMVNPDGAEAQTRHNSNGADLNRSWSYNPAGDVDEIKIIHGHLRTLYKQIKNVSIVLDMHGSFTKDFIYRVDKKFKGINFYNHQQKFISELKLFDPFQFGNFELSNGHPKMSRIVMVKNYGLHALTHETPRDIPIRNRNGRSIKTLLNQGVALVKSIRNLYE